MFRTILFMYCLVIIFDCIKCAPNIIVTETVPTTPPTIRTTQKPPIHWQDPNWVAPIGPIQEHSTKFWLDAAEVHLKKQLQKNQLNINKAKNIIIMIGDGMSIATQTAVRMYMGGEELSLAFEKFPYTGLSKTYCVNHQVPDSACTASAILTGVKNNYGTVGVNAGVGLRNCTLFKDKTRHIDTILKYAQDAGKATGVVTTTRVTHATPAAAYAKSPDRNWENDSAIPKDCNVDDIAKQLVYGDIGKRLNVILGGGAREFIPNSTNSAQGSLGLRHDNRNLIEEWLTERKKQGVSSFVSNRSELLQVDENNTKFLFGMFNHNHLSYKLENIVTEPTLAEMSLKALKILQKNNNGYVLFIEGGKIDVAHHINKAKLAFEETVELHKTVEILQKNININDTLMIVTADHSHTMSIGGYPKRGNNILGMGDFSNEDKMPIFTLNYANGMSYFKHVNENCTRERLTPIGMISDDNDFEFPAAVPLEEETHGGDDVGVYAIGPWAHLFTGSYEQNYIAHAMMYASCLGNGLKADVCHTTNAASKYLESSKLSLLLLIFIRLCWYFTSSK